MRLLLRLFLFLANITEIFLEKSVRIFGKILRAAIKDENYVISTIMILLLYEILSVLIASEYATSVLVPSIWAAGPLIALVVISFSSGLYDSFIFSLAEFKKLATVELERSNPEMGFRAVREKLDMLPNSDEAFAILNAVQNSKAFYPDSPNKVVQLCEGIAYIHGKQEGLLLESGKLLSEQEKLEELRVFLNKNSVKNF